MYTIQLGLVSQLGYYCCFVDETKSLHLKITPSLPDPPTIQDHHVPIFTCSQEDIDSAPWDLTIQQARDPACVCMVCALASDPTCIVHVIWLCFVH